MIQKRGVNLNPRDELNDKKLFLSCGKKISRERILEAILHEMIHSCGGDHNNRSSSDKDNYYKSIEEIKQYFPMANLVSEEIPKTSSVMDYIPGDVPQLTVLGKYDLNTLRYLYMDQVEKQGGGLLALNTPEDPDQQQELSKDILSQMKDYAHCADTIQSQKKHPITKVSILDVKAEDFLCLPYDYGSSPLEIVKFEIDKFRRFVNGSRYRYDSAALVGRVVNSYPVMYRIPYFYAKWIQVRNQYLATNGLAEEARLVLSSKDESIENYKTTIQGGLSLNKEYAQYYPIRKMVADFFMDLIFTETMKCKVQDKQGTVRSLELNAIRQALLLKWKDQLYVRDCHSKHVTDFLTKNNLSLVDQFGVEDFHSYYSEGINSDKNDVYPKSYFVRGLQDFSDKIAQASVALPMTGMATSENMQSLKPITSLTKFEQEPDLFSLYIERFQRELFEDGPNKSNFELMQLARSFTYLPISMHINLFQSSKHDSNYIKLKNLEPFFSVTYDRGTGKNSFFKKVIEPLRLGSTVESINIPFLTESYRDYMKKKKETTTVQQHIMGFEKYLMDQDSVLRVESNTFTLPFKSGSFIEKVIKKYNENLNLISAFDERKQNAGNLTVIETIDRQGLLAYNLFLKGTAKVTDFLDYSETK